MILAANPLLLRKLCTLIHFWGNLRIEFNVTQKKVTIETKADPKVISEFKYLISGFLALVYSHQCIWRKGGSPLDTVTAWNCLMLLILSQSHILQVRNKAKEIAVLINVLFQLDSAYYNPSGSGSNTGKMKGILAFAYMTLFTAVACPIGIVYGMHWSNHCKSALVGYWLIRKCYSGMEATNLNNSLVDLVSRFGVILPNHWLWPSSFHP